MTNIDRNTELFVVPEQFVKLSFVPQCIKNVMMQFNCQSFNVKQFLLQSSEDDLTNIFDVGVAAKTDVNMRVSLALFTAFLLNSEGIVVRISDELTQYVRRLLLMIQFELLARYHIVEVNYNALTLENKLDTGSLFQLTDLGQQIYKKIIIKEI